MSSSGPDIYAAPLAALAALKPDKPMTRGGMAAHLAEGLARWDVQKHGAWEDAVAVASRRNGIVSQSSFTALAALQGLKSKRANEVGSDVRKALLRLRELSPDGKKRLIQPNIRMIRDSK